MLPAPRDPGAPRAVPPDPPPEPPPLAPLFTRLLRSAGAQAVHAVDGARGEVLAEVGLADGDDVPALAQLARAATALGRGRGEWLEDLVVTLGRTVHVLRECDGVVLHARLDPTSGDVGAVRRGLAASEVLRAAEAAGRARWAAEPAGAGARGSGAHAARPGPDPDTAGPGPSGPRRPASEASWPYTLPAPAPTPTPSPTPRSVRSDAPRSDAPRPDAPRPDAPRPDAPRPAPARPAARRPDAPRPGAPRPDERRPDERRPDARRPNERRPDAPRPAEPRPSGSPGPGLTALPTAPSLPRVVPQPRRVTPRPQGSLPGPARALPAPRPVPRPRMEPPPERPPERPPDPSSLPLPLPVPRSAPGAGAGGRDPALVTVDGAHAISGTGALAVLALPPVGVLPRRRQATVAPPSPVPRSIVTPPVLRQPWASDVATMSRLVAGLHRLN